MEGHRVIRALAIYSIVCISATLVSSLEVNSSVPATFSEVFMQCIRAENLPAIENESEILKVLLTISQSNRIFMSFLNCMGNKTATFRKSTDSTEWYLARVFDKNYAKMFADQVVTNSSDDISCLTSMGKMDRLEKCLRNVTMDIGVIKKNHSDLLERLTDEEFQRRMCITLKATGGYTPQSCFSEYDSSNCSKALQQFLTSYIRMISCDNSYAPTTTTSTPASPTPSTMPIIVSSSSSSGPVAPPTAFFSCLAIVYPGKSFQMLFPPSEITLSFTGNNLIQAQHQHEMAIDDFCGKIAEYSQCIKIKLADPTNSIDALHAQYVDADNFENAFSEYCANKQLVKSNFQCTYRSTSRAPVCRGGMNDVITAIMNTVSVQMWTLCRRFKTARECRVNKQLKICNSEFATVMEKVMTGVLNEQCRAGEIIFPENEMTDLLPCFAGYMGGILDRRPRKSGNPNKRPTMSQILDLVLNETSEVCSNKDALFSCLTRKLKSSTKRVDQFMKSMFSVENMIKIMDFSCAMISDLQTESSCLVENLGDFTNRNYTECIANAAETMSMNMKNMINATSELPTEPFCQGMESILDCYNPILSKCGRKIVGKFDQLLDATKNSCGDLSYKLEFQSESAGAFNSLAPLTLTLMILANYLV